VIPAHLPSPSVRALAKQRAARRRRQEGAAMFVVAMMIAVLASLGVFALAAAATEVRMSGNERQSTQTHYMAEYGILAASYELGKNGKNEVGSMMAMKNPCVALGNVPATAPVNSRYCARNESKDYRNTVFTAGPMAAAYGGQDPYTKGIPPGSLGAVPMAPDFVVEETDLGNAQAQGVSRDSCYTALITVTSYGQTQPVFQGPDNPTARFGSEGLEIQRAQIETRV